MTAWLRVASTLIGMALHVVVALVIVGILFHFHGPAGRHRLVRWWSRRLLDLCRIELHVADDGSRDRLRNASDNRLRDADVHRVLSPGGPGAMLVMNHVSWVDIFVIHALRPARFVAKAEIAGWPVLGYLTARTGSFFIERGKRHAVREVNHRAAAMIAAGDLIGMFPEGAVSDGRRLLPFHANLIQPAIDARAPIVVAGLRYRDARGGPSDAMYYVGDVTMLQSLVRIARHGRQRAELHLIATIDGAGTTRHDVARTARALISDSLGFDDEEQALEDLSTVVVVDDADGDAGRRETFSRDAVLAGTARGTALDPRDELL